MAVLNEVLKNKDDFSVPSGGKDTYAYWSAFKPQFERVATALASRVVDSVRVTVKDGSAWPAPAMAAPAAPAAPAASASEAPAAAVPAASATH